MPVALTTPLSSLLLRGGEWVVGLLCTDSEGQLASGTITIQVTGPDDEVDVDVVAVESETGIYEATFTPVLLGRHVMSAVSTGDATGVAAALVYVQDPTTAGGMPSAAAVGDYLGQAASAWTSDEITGALNAEAAAQRRVCTIGPVYTTDLAEALKRRVAVNLAKRGIPLAIVGGDADGAVGSLSRWDPEVSRLEREYRKVFFA